VPGELRSAETPAYALRDYLSALRRARLFILVATLAGALLGLAGTWAYPRSFSAVVTLGLKPGARPVSFDLVRTTLGKETVVAETLSGLNLDKPPHALTPKAFLADHVRADQVPGAGWRIWVTLRDPDTAVQAANRLGAAVVRTVTEDIKEDLEVDRKRLEGRMLRARARQEAIAEEAVRSGLRRGARGGSAVSPSGASRETPIRALLLDYELQAATRLYMDAFTQHEEQQLLITDVIGPAVLAPAVRDDNASSPPPAGIVALGAVLGFAVATAAAIALAALRGPLAVSIADSPSRSEIRHVR
jgi:uncharacterized protein involved in exopolysaccharide biosynthesis